MSIRFHCAACGKKLKAADEQAGDSVECPGCGAELLVPDAGKPSRAAGSRGEDEQAAADAPIKFHEHPKEHEELVDMTAMVDIVFFLLIFFMVTSIQSLQAALEMPNPDPQESKSGQASAESPDSSDSVTVRIDSDNVVSVDDVEAPSRQEVISLLRQAHDERGATQLIVMPSANATCDKIVMAIDAAPASGMEGVRFVALPEDEF